MNEPVIIIGGGGHARVIAEAVRMLGATVLGHTEVRPRDGGADRPGFDLLGDDRCILEHAPDAVVLANGLGSVGAPGARRDVFVDFLARGYRFPSLVHPAATVSSEAELGEGVQVMAGAVVQAGCLIGDNVIINTGAIVDHDSKIAEHAHVAPGAVICGGVRVGAGSHVGAGATIIHNVEIGEACIVGAGAVVVGDQAGGSTLKGIPAR